MNSNPPSLNVGNNNWRENYSGQDEDYEAAYQIGHESYDRYLNKSFDEVESKLKQDYESLCAQHGRTGLPWSQAKETVRTAWDEAATT